MNGELVQAIFTGIMLPESVLHSDFVGILEAVVAINTVMFGALAVSKLFPKIHPSDIVHGRNRRSETRSIHPDAPI